ncbi:hypothetical protein ACVWZV_002247 [Bradyrhizobium sp. GM5.1]
MRIFLGIVGLILGFLGIVLTSTEWMLERPQFWGHWVVLIIGAILWVQAIPVMTDREVKYILGKRKSPYPRINV